MDFHDLPDGVTAAHVAEMHQADLKIEHKYNCRGLTYWCDELRQTAFCLIEAPNEQAIIDLHQKAHGGVPQRIIEVNDTIVESFLGRIKDPEKSQNTKLNIINDPAFRTLMQLSISRNSLRKEGIQTLVAALKGYHKSISNIVSNHNGRVIKERTYSYLISFDSVTNAIHSALEIQELHNCVITPDLEFNLGISAGVPVTDKEHLFEDTIHEVGVLCEIKGGSVNVTSEVKELYESENRDILLRPKGIHALSSSQLQFLVKLLDFTEAVWTNSNTSALDFSKHLGYSKSKLYRTMMSVIGKSPNGFLKDYRLSKALGLIDKKGTNISEIAYNTGFSSPSYFSKCFLEKFGLLPSKYINISLIT